MFLELRMIIFFLVIAYLNKTSVRFTHTTSMDDEARFREMMRRFAPQSKKRVVVANIVEDATTRPKKKRSAGGRKPVNGVSFPIEIWAKILQWLPHVSYLIPISMLNKSLRAAVW
jgi:hypothetical protein